MRVLVFLLVAVFGSVAWGESGDRFRFEVHVVEFAAEDHSEPGIQLHDLEQLKKLDNVEAFEVPGLTAFKDQLAEIKLKPSPRVLYLKKTSEGQFQLVESKSVDIGLKVSCKTDGKKATVTVRRVSVLGGDDGEIDVLGVRVPVGKPRTEEVRLETTLKVGDAGYHILEISSKNKRQTILACSVARVD